jgi:hypothetical protein
MDLVKQAADFGAGIFISVIFLVFMWQSWNKLSERYNALMQAWNAQLHEDKIILIDLVKGNQAALADAAMAINSNTAIVNNVKMALEALCRRIETQEQQLGEHRIREEKLLARRPAKDEKPA